MRLFKWKRQSILNNPFYLNIWNFEIKFFCQNKYDKAKFKKTRSRVIVYVNIVVKPLNRILFCSESTSFYENSSFSSFNFLNFSQKFWASVILLGEIWSVSKVEKLRVWIGREVFKVRMSFSIVSEAVLKFEFESSIFCSSSLTIY